MFDVKLKQYFSQMQRSYFIQEVGNSPCSLVMSLRQMFSQNMQLSYMYAEPVCKWLNLPEYWDYKYEQFSTYGALLDGLMLGMNIETGEASLYTSCIEEIRKFAQQGRLNYVKNKKQPADILDSLQSRFSSPDSFKRTITDTSSTRLFTARIDTKVMRGVMYVEGVTIPRSLPSLETHIFYPLRGYQECINCIDESMHNGILKLVMGDKVRFVTKLQSILLSLFKEERVKRLLSHSPDIYTQRYYVPSLTASEYSSGVTNINPFAIDSISFANIRDIDLSETRLNLMMVKDFYKQSVGKFSDEERSKLESVLGDLDTLYKGMKDRELWALMKEYNEYFHTENYKNMPNKYGDLYDYEEVPKTLADLNSILRTGIHRVTLQRRGGTYSTVVCTNDSRELRRVYGRDLWYMESVGVRVRAYRSAIKGVDLESALDLIGAYGLDDYIYEVFSFEELYEILDELEGDVYSSATVIPQKDKVLVRNLRAEDSTEYYKYIDLGSVTEIVRLK